ncbi:helix-turn-helix domain-containing protein, partial [Nocardia sp. NPDC004722]
MTRSAACIGIPSIATQSGLPLPTIHRLVRTLVDLGYLHQEPT